MRTILDTRYQPAFFERERPVAAACERQIVSDENRRELVSAVQAFQEFEDHFAGPVVEVSGRLVGEKNRGIANQGTGEDHPLLLPPG